MNHTPESVNNWVARLTEQARILWESRMIRDEQPVTPELGALVFRRLREFLERTGKAQTWAAKSMGVSPTTLSQLLSGTYNASTDEHVRSIDRWLEQQILREAAPKPRSFVKIGASEQIYGMARLAMQDGGISLIFGPAGIGKTMTLQAIRAETPGSIYVSITTAGNRPRAVLRQIAAELRIGQLCLTMADTFNELVAALKDSGRLLLIDEVHKLAGKEKDAALHVLRDLADHTGIPMVWCGNQAIYDYLQRGKSAGNDPLCQIHSRISFFLNLTEAVTKGDGGDGLFTLEDIRKVFAASKIRLTPDATRFLQMLANLPERGSLRLCQAIVLKARRMAGDSAITTDMLREVMAQCLSATVAEAVETEMGSRFAAVG